MKDAKGRGGSTPTRFEREVAVLVKNGVSKSNAEQIVQSRAENLMRQGLGVGKKTSSSKAKGSADTQEKKAEVAERKRTGKGQGYDKLTTPAQIAAYYAAEKAKKRK